MTKMTYVNAIDYVLDTYTIDNAEVREKLDALKAQLIKRAGAERKPTAKQNENASIRAEVVAFINDNMADNGFTCAELIATCPVLAGKSNQYVSALMRQAVQAGEISKGTVKRRTYFAPYGFYAEEKGE